MGSGFTKRSNWHQCQSIASSLGLELEQGEGGGGRIEYRLRYPNGHVRHMSPGHCFDELSHLSSLSELANTAE